VSFVSARRADVLGGLLHRRNVSEQRSCKHVIVLYIRDHASTYRDLAQGFRTGTFTLDLLHFGFIFSSLHTLE